MAEEYMIFVEDFWKFFSEFFSEKGFQMTSRAVTTGFSCPRPRPLKMASQISNFFHLPTLQHISLSVPQEAILSPTIIRSKNKILFIENKRKKINKCVAQPPVFIPLWYNWVVIHGKIPYSVICHKPSCCKTDIQWLWLIDYIICHIVKSSKN